MLGGNSSGKSTLLKAIALALIGPVEGRACLQDYHSWIRSGEKEAKISLEIVRDRDYDKFKGKRGNFKDDFNDLQ